MRVTPENITDLKDNEIILFGSNSHGAHYGGLARICHERFGAILGIARGEQGKCYAIDTMSGLAVIKQQIPSFLEYCINNPDKKIFITQIGTGIANYSVEQIAPMFEEATKLNNIYLHQKFWDVLNK